GVIGTAAGIALRNPAAGAAIGAAGGATIGGLAGAAEDRREDKEKAQAMQEWKAVQAAQAAQAAKRLSLWDVITLAQQHISDEVIIQQIRSTASHFDLNT